MEEKKMAIELASELLKAQNCYLKRESELSAAIDYYQKRDEIDKMRRVIKELDDLRVEKLHLIQMTEQTIQEVLRRRSIIEIIFGI